MSTSNLSESQLAALCAALGWQGGTYWQVLDEVRRLKVADSLAVAPKAEPAVKESLTTQAAPQPAIESAIKALVQAAFLEGGVSLERTAQARAETQARETELIALIGGAPPAAVEPMMNGLVQQHHRDSQELRRLCAARDQARSERDALKAEIAGLEASCSTLGRLVDELRPDAERLEWVLRRCAGSWLRAYLGVVSDTGDMDTLRTLIDANRGALTAHGIGMKKKGGT